MNEGQYIDENSTDLVGDEDVYTNYDDEQEEAVDNGPYISNVEWGMVIGGLLCIDIIQIILDVLVVGLFVNRLIDIFVGMSFAFYLHMRGQSLANKKRAVGMIGAFFLELIPGVSDLPLWCLDGIYMFVLYKSDKILAKVPGGSKVASTLGR